MGALPLTAVAGNLGSRAALFALNRLAYGPRPGDVDRVISQGIERWVRDQLAPAGDPDLDTRLGSLTTLGLSTSQVLALYNADQRSISTIVDEFTTAKLIRAAHGRNQLAEVLTDFWFNHFNVNINDGFVRYSIMSYERDAIRPHVLGRFRDLLGAMTAHPAMLYYLDNYQSSATVIQGGRLIRGLNENFGRELLELHTVGVDAGYTQQDVYDAARCFTGWTIDSTSTGGNFVYRSANHDTTAKSAFGLSLPAGGQQDDGNKLLDYLATHPATASFISRKLARRFVADDPPESLVARMADAFLASDGDIGEVLLRMVSSAEFWAAAFDPASAKPKTPLEFAVSAIRAADAQVSAANRGLATYIGNLGTPLYACVPPTGWSDRGSDWVNPSSQLYRMNFAIDLAANTVGGVTVDAQAAAAGADFTSPRSVGSAIDEQVFGATLSAGTLDAIARLDTRSSVTVASRALTLSLCSPEFQEK
jgi:uncharacterized protein (DUF1800 family)